MTKSFINRPISGFIISIVFTIGASALSFYSIGKFLKSEKWVEHTNMVHGKLESIISTMKDAETGQRGFLLTGNEAFLQPYSKSEILVRSAFDTVSVLTADNGAQQSELSGLKELIDAKFELLKNTIAQKKKGDLVSAEALLTGKSYMDRTRTTITRMQNREEILLAVRLATSKIDGIITQTSIIFAFLISMASTIFFYNRMVKNYSERLRLEQSLREETANLERRIALLKSHSERIGDGEYGIQLDADQLR